MYKGLHLGNVILKNGDIKKYIIILFKDLSRKIMTKSDETKQSPQIEALKAWVLNSQNSPKPKRKPFIKPKFKQGDKVKFKYPVFRWSIIYVGGKQVVSKKEFLIFGDVKKSRFNSYDKPDKPTFWYEIVPRSIAEKDLEAFPALSDWLAFYIRPEAYGDFSVDIEESKISLITL